MEMKDWRGNIYKETKLWYVGKNGKRVPKSCELCQERQAVRNCCTAEGDIGRTHWHGAVHCREGGLKYLCRECADKENAKQ